MGWEYHDRRRNKDGQFVPRENYDQIHLRLRRDEADRIRDAAKIEHMEISAWCVATLLAVITANGQGGPTNGGPP